MIVINAKILHDEKMLIHLNMMFNYSKNLTVHKIIFSKIQVNVEDDMSTVMTTNNADG